MHGGLSPDLNSMEQIRRVMRPTDVSFLRLTIFFCAGFALYAVVSRARDTRGIDIGQAFSAQSIALDPEASKPG